jgi:formamidopyrimidine-DNA glycosylase
MPEGPEAHTIAAHLKQALLGKFITSIRTGARAKQNGLQTVPLPNKIVDIRAYAKKPMFFLASGHIIITALGMTGRWDWTAGKHSHVLFDISQEDGNFLVEENTLYFHDTRGFGSITVVWGQDQLNQFFFNTGPDLLLRELTPDEWRLIFQRDQGNIRNKEICIVLLDQSVVSGIGNYLKSEILYRAHIRPNRQVWTINDNELEALRQAAYATIRESYSHGGLTISDYWGPNGHRGVFPVQVYNRNIDSFGNKIERATFSDKRTSFWVPSLQI